MTTIFHAVRNNDNMTQSAKQKREVRTGARLSDTFTDTLQSTVSLPDCTHTRAGLQRARVCFWKRTHFGTTQRDSDRERVVTVVKVEQHIMIGNTMISARFEIWLTTSAEFFFARHLGAERSWLVAALCMSGRSQCTTRVCRQRALPLSDAEALWKGEEVAGAPTQTQRVHKPLKCPYNSNKAENSEPIPNFLVRLATSRTSCILCTSSMARTIWKQGGNDRKILIWSFVVGRLYYSRSI